MTIPATGIQSFVATIPAGTDMLDPVTQDCSFPDASVVGIRWRVPPGPSGLMGFQITSDGAPVIPVQPGMYIVADNESADWNVAAFQDSGSWQVTGYNNDSFDHSVYLDFLTVPAGQDVPAAGPTAPAPVTTSNADLSSSPPDATGWTAGVQVQT